MCLACCPAARTSSSSTQKPRPGRRARGGVEGGLTTELEGLDRTRRDQALWMVAMKEAWK